MQDNVKNYLLALLTATTALPLIAINFWLWSAIPNPTLMQAVGMCLLYAVTHLFMRITTTGPGRDPEWPTKPTRTSAKYTSMHTLLELGVGAIVTVLVFVATWGRFPAGGLSCIFMLGAMGMFILTWVTSEKRMELLEKATLAHRLAPNSDFQE